MSLTRRRPRRPRRSHGPAGPSDARRPGRGVAGWLALAALLIAGLARPGLAQSPTPEIPVEPLPVRHCANPPEYPSSGRLDAKLHINQLKGAWGFANVAPEHKDADGYPTRLEGKPAVSRILYSHPDLSGLAPYAGTFRLYGRGTGAFRINWGEVLPRQATIRLPRETLRGQDYWYVDFTYDPAGPVNRVKLEILDLPIWGDHIRDMALVHHSHLEAWRSGGTFMPEIVADLSLFGHGQAPRRGALRYMHALQTNGIWMPGKQTTPLTQTDAMRERRFVRPSHYSYARMQNPSAGGGYKLVPTAMPVEDIVTLANATGTHVWYTLSADITDSRAEAIAIYLRDHLDPGLKVYWEYGNELWNSAPGFASFQYARAMGQAAFPGLGEVSAVYEWDVYRSMQLFARIRELFAATPERARFVATFWAMAGSNHDDGRIRENSYAARYFAAEAARRKPDIGAHPEDIITDMAVGGYFGSLFGSAADWLMEAYDTDQDRAAAFTRLVEHGLDGLVALGPRALDQPVTGVDATTDIAAHHLLERDIEAGLDPWRELPQVLRRDGRSLQYRGVRSETWTDVLEFAVPPKDDVAGLVKAGRLMGFGRRFYGANFEGFNSQLRNVLRYRVLRHAAFAKAHGLEFHFYEGGANMASPPGDDPERTRGLADAYQYGGWAARIEARMLAKAAPHLTQICWFQSHNRYDDGYWGLKRRVGQDPAEAPKWGYVAAAIAAANAARPEAP